jgi:hypothetical protein
MFAFIIKRLIFDNSNLTGNFELGHMNLEYSISL